MLRISTTTLESFRRIIATDYGDERALIKTILGEPPPPSWQMAAGSDWHRAMASPLDTYSASLRTGPHGYQYGPGTVLFAREAVGPGIWEVKAQKVLDVCGCPVTLVAQADHVHGMVITENKTKFSAPDARQYEASLQWRCYLLVHDAACVRYVLWHFDEPQGCRCHLKDFFSFRFWPYPRLEADVRWWLSEFLDWAHRRRLTQHLERESSTPSLAGIC